MLWNVLGGSSDEVWPDVYRDSLEAGDILLLATDGLTLEVPDERIASILTSTSTARESTAALLRAATDAGGRDNVTAVVVRFGERSTPVEAPAAAAEAALADSGPVPLPASP